jgi:DNA-binding MarR family transcriptional regulator
MTDSSDSEQFESAYVRLWAALHRGDEADLRQHERDLLHHVPVGGGVSLGALAAHLALPKSSASVLVKDLERRGFLSRLRDPADERRLAIVLTDEGRRRVDAGSVLDLEGLRTALAALAPSTRSGLLRGLTQLADAAELRLGLDSRTPSGAERPST